MKTIFKKLGVCILALTMVLAFSVSAFAAGPSTDTTISITGLQDGDIVTFYQVLKYDTNADGGWSATTDFSGITASTITDGEITAADAAAIVEKAFQATATTTVTASNGTASYTITNENNAGLYVAFVTPKSGDAVTLYNPVFVSADFDDNDTNTIDISTATGTYNSGEAKKQTPTVDKEMDNTDDNSVMVGDTVPFTITTTIPAYATYKAPVFKVSDAVSTGLEIDTDTITLVAPSGLTEDKDYKINNASTAGFEIEFLGDYLKTLTASAAVEIKYSAEVTSEAPKNVNEMLNTATIKYSNNPLDDKGNGTDEDETYHYTFTIDGNIDGTETLGTDEQITNKEVIKTAVDSEGNPILDTVREYNTPGKTTTETTEASPLSGCVFKLTGGKLPADGVTYTTLADGLIVFKGLDEGTYTLEEVSAPAGYVKDGNPHTVVISATYNTDGTLASYTITIDGVANTFTAANTKTGEVKTVWTSGQTIVLSSLIENVKAKALPATGGIGTTIFYIVGAILLIGASVLMVVRRRVNNSNN